MNTSTPSVETILAQAVEIAAPEERQAFVEQACAGDAELQRQVERLIANHFQAGSFLERPAVAMDPDGTAGWETAGVGRTARARSIGPYKLLEQIGEGGMGVVYVAEQTPPVRRKVALKIIKPGMDTKQVVARFEAERQALAMMDHPNIAKVHDAGATDSGPALLRHGAGPRHPDHRILRPRAALDPRAAGAVRPGLPGRAARPPEGDHPPRPQAVEHPGDGHRRRRRAQDHRLRRGQGHRPVAHRADALHRLPPVHRHAACT